MKKVIMGAAILAVLALAGSATAATRGYWVPGSNYMVEETDASDLLEQVYDHAYCTGVPRFGHRGEFPYDSYLVFDCTVVGDGYSCLDNRYKTVKGSKRGYFKARLIRRGDCY